MLHKKAKTVNKRNIEVFYFQRGKKTHTKILKSKIEIQFKGNIKLEKTIQIENKYKNNYVIVKPNIKMLLLKILNDIDF